MRTASPFAQVIRVPPGRVALSRVGAAWHAQPPRRVSDGHLWHGDEDRLAALDLIGDGFRAFRKDVEPRVIQGDVSPACAQWWSVEARTSVDEWQAFEQRMRSSPARMTTAGWRTYEDWLDRLRYLRSSARAHGFVLLSKEPLDLPSTAFEQGDQGRGESSSTLWTLGKVALVTTLGLAGVLSIGGFILHRTPQISNAQSETRAKRKGK